MSSVEGVDHPTPEDKNWTWVLDSRCDDCGFEAATVDRDQLGALARANAARWRGLLSRGGLVATRPPSDDGVVWSALEYGCHVRDVYRVLDERLQAMLTEDDPEFADWDQNQTAIDDSYLDQDPGHVSYELAVVAGQVADMLDRVNGKEWDRPGRRSDGDGFTVESLARYLLHDVTHHVWDVEEGYEALTEDD